MKVRWRTYISALRTMGNEDIHLKINMKCMFVLGAYRFGFNNYVVDICYRIYSYIIKIYFVTFVICAYVELITTPDKSLFNINSILAVALIYSTTIWRMIVCNGKGFQKLIKQLRAIESALFSYKNKDVEDIYYVYARRNHVSSIGFIWVGVITVFLYHIRPIMEKMTSEPAYVNVIENNVTMRYKMSALPINSWFPFNRYKYYYLCYTYHIIALTIGGSMVVSTDLFFIALMIFVIGQLKILQYNFKNAITLGENIADAHGRNLSYAIRYCVRQHQIIIK